MEPIGEGGAGEIFMARPHASLTELPPVIVVKTLRAHLSHQPEFTARFKHEAELAVQLDCKSVARVYESGRAGDELYIAMEFVPGWPLQDILREGKKPGSEMSVEEGLAVFDGLLQGVEELHAAKHRQTQEALNVVHRDLSPRNVMLQEDGRLRLIDLGIGKSSLQSWKTAVGTTMGSLGYMPPEQLIGQEVDQRADIYALGAVLFELVTLTPYLEPAAAPVMLHKGLNPDLKKASEIRSGVPQALDDIILHALALNPEKRIQSAKEFRLALWSQVSRPESSHTFRLARRMSGDDLVAQTQLRDRVELAGSSGATPTPAEVYAAAPEVTKGGNDSGPVTEMVWVQARAKVGDSLPDTQVPSTSDPVLPKGRSADDLLYGTGRSSVDALYGDLYKKPEQLYPEIPRVPVPRPRTKHVGLAAWWFPWALAPLVAASLVAKMRNDAGASVVKLRQAAPTPSVSPKVVPRAAPAVEPKPTVEPVEKIEPKKQRRRRARRKEKKPLVAPVEKSVSPIAPSPVRPLEAKPASRVPSTRELQKRARRLIEVAPSKAQQDKARQLVPKILEIHQMKDGRAKSDALRQLEKELKRIGG